MARFLKFVRSFHFLLREVATTSVLQLVVADKWIGALLAGATILSTVLDLFWIHKSVAEVANLRPVAEDFRKFVPCNHLVLSGLREIRVISCLVCAETY